MLTLINVAGSVPSNSGHRIGYTNKGVKMNANSNELADRVVNSFQDLLDSNMREAIGDSNLNALRSMISEVITERSKTIFGRLQENLEQVESEMLERIPMEL